MKEPLPIFHMTQHICSGKTKTKFLSQRLDENEKWKITWLYSVYEIDRVNHTVRVLLTDSHSYNDAVDLTYSNRE